MQTISQYLSTEGEPTRNIRKRLLEGRERLSRFVSTGEACRTSESLGQGRSGRLQVAGFVSGHSQVVLDLVVPGQLRGAVL